MTPTAWLVGAVLVAVVDWVAVGVDRRRIEYLAKPLTMVMLIAYAVALDPVDVIARWWFVAALAFSLAGDVFLMLPARPQDRQRSDRFVEGLASFLIGHIAYITGLGVWGPDVGAAWFVLVLAVGVGVVTLGRIIVSSAGEHDRRLRTPVGLYIATISAMVLVAGSTGHGWFVAGALLFYASDALIGITRFVRDIANGRVAIMITYHLAQFMLVYGLTIGR